MADLIALVGCLSLMALAPIAVDWYVNHSKEWKKFEEDMKDNKDDHQE